MFSKIETSQLKQEFWTAFGLYMKPIPFAEGEKNNWVNYKTGIKDILFRMQANTKQAIISIEICHKDKDLQLLYFEQFEALKNLLHKTLGEEWVWSKNIMDEAGHNISSISKKLENVNILNKSDWPDIISFFKQRIIALDEFWSMAVMLLDTPTLQNVDQIKHKSVNKR